MPRPLEDDADMPEKRSLRQVLAANLAKVRAHRNLSQPKIAEATRRGGAPINQTTVGRIERGAHPATVDSLESLARALGVQGWQLLVEQLDPANPPTLGAGDLSSDELELVRKYRAATPRWRMALQHLAALRADQQEEVSEGTMVLLAKASAEPAKDERVEHSFGRAPHVIHEPRAAYKKHG